MEPQDREEAYLANAAGDEVTLPACPWNRKEAYLADIGDRLDGIDNDVSELNQKVAALATDFSYKGSVADYAHLPSDAAVGDVYTTEDEGYMYVWDGTRWQILNMTGAGALTGDSDPTSSTEGTLGQLYLNTTSGELFYCSATGDTYTWVSLDSPIQSISVNGTAVTPDANKNVDLTIPDGIKTLTTADYPSGQNYISLWSLASGVYVAGENILVKRTSSDSAATFYKNGTIVVGKDSGNSAYVIIDSSVQVGQVNAFGSGTASYVLKQSNIVDNLASTSATAPLSANQGRVLNEKIGDLTTLTTTAKTSTVAAINELDSDLGKVEPLSGSGAPTTSTAGVVGQDYVDTATGDKYYLSAIVEESGQPDSYTWVKYATGSGGPTVVQTTGTSTTDVMSQNAVTGMVYADPGTGTKIQIGSGASTTGTEGALAIGLGSASSMNGSTAIGPSAQATQVGSVAIGSGARTSAPGEVQIGTIFSSKGYNGSNYRLLTGVYDPQTAHDAANKQYVDNNAVGTTETLTIADTDWSALSSSDPYTYSATVSVTATIGANSTVSLINDAAVDFATYGFAIGSVDQPNNTITFYSIGAPSASKSLTINIKG